MNVLIDSDRRLPEQVFRREPRALGFFEFDELLESSFWIALQRLAAVCDEESVHLVSIDPDAERYFRHHFGYYGALELDVQIDATHYLEAIGFEPSSSPADSLATNCRTCALVARSGAFGVWAERDVEVGVVALFDPKFDHVVPLPNCVPWRTATEVVELAAPAFRNSEVMASFMAAFLKNYRT